MKKIISNIVSFYRKYELSFYLSLFGSFFMGSFHLVFTIINFDWILLTYCIFSYLMFLFKIWQWSINKYQIKPHPYIAAIISILIICIPMMAAFILTVLFKDKPHYLFDWFIYGYAFYGTIKMYFGIRNLCKKNKSEYKTVLSYYGLLGALYTLQMMEFQLIATFSNGEINNSMFLMQLFTLGTIFLISFFIVGIFIYKLIMLKKQNKVE